MAIIGGVEPNILQLPPILFREAQPSRGEHLVGFFKAALPFYEGASPPSPLFSILDFDEADTTVGVGVIIADNLEPLSANFLLLFLQFHDLFSLSKHLGLSFFQLQDRYWGSWLVDNQRTNLNLLALFFFFPRLLFLFKLSPF